ncbi:hypothetical protein Y1Q_0018993 [Alligator mississippiensis]|uniref:Uncharacterized protein n=1 Tax=Alligator mississippiensis TaxID=8496 RepID=A0A151M3F8_ALLMI|nr:hypothetical protein Y1Q_0018993 [Alligator mississippiensis]
MGGFSARDSPLLLAPANENLSFCSAGVSLGAESVQWYLPLSDHIVGATVRCLLKFPNQGLAAWMLGAGNNRQGDVRDHMLCVRALASCSQLLLLNYIPNPGCSYWILQYKSS